MRSYDRKKSENTRENCSRNNCSASIMTKNYCRTQDKINSKSDNSIHIN